MENFFEFINKQKKKIFVDVDKQKQCKRVCLDLNMFSKGFV